MRLTFTYIIRPNKTQDKIIKELMWHSSKVYNMLNYNVKEGKEKINTNGILNVEGSRIYKKYRKENWHSEYLHSHMLQQIILNYIGDYKSYIAIKGMYEKEDKVIKGKPRMPRYKKEEKVQITFTKYAIRKEGRTIRLSISKKIQEKFQIKSLNFLIPKKLEKLVNLESIKMIKIGKEKNGKYKLDIIYEKEEKKRVEGSNIIAIDLGMNNLATCTNMKNNKSLIIAGESIKAKIGYINKEIGRLEGIQMKMVGSKKYKNTKRINKLYEQRRNYSKTYMHKASRLIIEYALQNECDTIVIGDIKDIKQNMQGNKRFVQMPIQNLVEKIEYKAKLEGIEVIKITEEYTSGVSSIDKEKRLAGHQPAQVDSPPYPETSITQHPFRHSPPGRQSLALSFQVVPLAKHHPFQQVYSFPPAGRQWKTKATSHPSFYQSEQNAAESLNMQITQDCSQTQTVHRCPTYHHRHIAYLFQTNSITQDMPAQMQYQTGNIQFQSPAIRSQHTLQPAVHPRIAHLFPTRVPFYSHPAIKQAFPCPPVVVTIRMQTISQLLPTLPHHQVNVAITAHQRLPIPPPHRTALKDLRFYSLLLQQIQPAFFRILQQQIHLSDMSSLTYKLCPQSFRRTTNGLRHSIHPYTGYSLLPAQPEQFFPFVFRQAFRTRAIGLAPQPQPEEVKEMPVLFVHKKGTLLAGQ